MKRSQVSARHQEAGRREARSKSVNHQQNLSATLDHDSASPPPPNITQEEKVQPKDKGLHAVARSKVLTNQRTRSTSKKVKEVMTQGDTQGVTRSLSCKRVKANLKCYAAPLPTNGVKARTGDPSTNQQPALSNRANERASWPRRTNEGSTLTSLERKTVIQSRKTMIQRPHRSQSTLSRAAKDRGTMARVANPYSENEDSDNED